MYGSIYKITNKINGKSYIGLSVDPHNRWSAHKSAAKRNQSSSNYFHNAIRKHGAENFEIEIICQAGSVESLIDLEKFWIQAFRSNVFGYNIKSGGEGGGITAYATCLKISAAKTGTNTGSSNHFYGHKHTDQSINKIKEARARQSFSEETRAKLGLKSSQYFASVAKKFGAYDTEGNLVISFKQNKDTKESGFNPANVSECLSGKRKTHRGYTWRYL